MNLFKRLCSKESTDCSLFNSINQLRATESDRIDLLAKMVATDSDELLFEIRNKKQTITIPLKNKDSYIKLNYKGIAFIRVLYDNNLNLRLKSAIKNHKLSSSDNATILSDINS